MKIEGRLTKTGKWWAVQVPLLLIHTQGKTKKEALLMAKDAVECLVDAPNDFEAIVTDCGFNTFCVSANNDTLLMSLALRQQRASHNMTVRQVATRMGSKSPNSYSRYERGKTKPSLDKFSQLLQAIDPRLDPVITIS
ncbi:MAG: type II toxin-antitoxin system HicB family antitoxin [Planctomycetota bacterium]|jgi:predicted RNase H-like HicB family nuclease